MGEHHVLFVDPKPSRRDRPVNALEEAGLSVLIAETGRDAMVRLDASPVDCVVYAGTPPDIRLDRFHDLVERHAPELPIIVLGPVESVDLDEITKGITIEYVPDEAGLVSVIEEIIIRNRIDEALSASESLTRAVLDIVNDLIDVETRSEITGLVYERLAALDRYRFVWLAGYDPQAAELELQRPTQTTITTTLFAGLVGAETPSYIDAATSEGTVETAPGGPMTRGATATHATTEATSSTGGASEPVQASVNVAVPLVHDGVNQGLVLLTSSTSVDSAERELLAVLGRFVGQALAAPETGDMVDPASFASVVVHELTNPLAIAELSLEKARESGDDKWLDKVAQSHRQMEHVLRDELSLLRGMEIEDTTYDALDKDAKEAWAFLETEEARLVIKGIHHIRAAHSLLVRLLANLFDNAISHGGDQTTVRVGGMDEGFYVEDDGEGIPESDRERLFEFGYSGNEGTGLGLAIVERIVDVHGWDIDVTESQSGGARFEVSGVDVREVR